MRVETLIHARWVIPVEPEGHILEHHSIAIEHGRIQAVLSSAEAQEQIQAGQVIELSQHALIPGLVNAHTHSPMSLFKGLADDMPLMAWLNDHIWPAETKWVNESFIADGSHLAIAEMLRSGTTCFNDMYFYPDVTAQVAAQSGIRSVVGLILIDFPSVWATDADNYLHKAISVHDTVRNEPLVSTAFAPHAPYSVSDESLQKLLTLADELDIPIHMHVQETHDEVQQSLAQHGMRPTQRLQQLGLINPSMVAVHMTQLEAQEIELMANSGSHVVHCPESNLKLASGFCPVQALLNAGVNVALGTDSSASNNDLDMLGEMHTAALLGKGIAQNASALPVAKVLEMATLNGAKALNLDDKIGSLITGKEADITAINLGALSCQPIYNPLSQIIYSSTHGQVSDVWVAGQHLVANGQLIHIDEAALLAKAAKWQEKIASTDS
jgi:5-methylthioadenosine/S-adenosylhomocysteine deaminase